MDAADVQVHTELQRTVGRLEGTVSGMAAAQTSMAAQHERFGEKLDKYDEKLDTILAYIEREKGSQRTWKTVAGIGGAIAGAVGGAVVSYFTGGGKP